MEFVDSLLGQEVMASASMDGAEFLPPPSFFADTGELAWICGQPYPGESEEDRSKIRQVLRSFIWQTYRKGFPPIGGENGPTSDRGWGCMLRCGQMVVAEAVTRLRLGRNWIWVPATGDKGYLKIVAMFTDDPESPFSIHQFAQTGAADGGKAVGQWYGPNTVAHVVRKLLAKTPTIRLRAHVVMDNMLVTDDIDEDVETWRPLLVFVPLRLGLSEVNPIYLTGLKACFRCPGNISLGVIGGTPNHALYFVGCVGEDVIYLDPHTTQASQHPMSKMSVEEAEADLTYHCSWPRRMPILQIDPSIAAVSFIASKPY